MFARFYSYPVMMFLVLMSGSSVLFANMIEVAITNKLRMEINVTERIKPSVKPNATTTVRLSVPEQAGESQTYWLCATSAHRHQQASPSTQVGSITVTATHHSLPPKVTLYTADLPRELKAKGIQLSNIVWMDGHQEKSIGELGMVYTLSKGWYSQPVPSGTIALQKNVHCRIAQSLNLDRSECSMPTHKIRFAVEEMKLASRDDMILID